MLEAVPDIAVVDAVAVFGGGIWQLCSGDNKLLGLGCTL